MKSPSFPSQEVIDRITRLKTVNAAPTDFKGMSAGEIAQRIIADFGGSITIDLSKAPEAERRPIRRAAIIDVDGQIPNITILGDNGDAKADEEGFTEEDRILRAITAEILDDSQEVNIGRIAFRRFVQTLIEKPENYPLVRDEWNSFIVEHAETGTIESPYESHHFPNVGLKRRSEGEDTLREQQIEFIKGIMEEFREQVATLFRNRDIFEHANDGMNTLDARLLALGEAEWSNFVRGGVYYRYRRGEASLDGYAPRRIAADIIDQVIAAQSEVTLTPEELREKFRDPHFLPTYDQVKTAFPTWEEFRDFCHDQTNPVFEVLNEEYLNGLADYFAGKVNEYSASEDRPLVILEIGAGNGRLSYFLQQKLEERVPGQTKVIATDSGKWNIENSFPVEELTHEKAINKHHPDIVVCSWMPPGIDFTADIRRCKSVGEYVLIGEADESIMGSPCGNPHTTWAGGLYEADGFQRENLAHLSPIQIGVSDDRGRPNRSRTVSFKRK